MPSESSTPQAVGFALICRPCKIKISHLGHELTEHAQHIANVRVHAQVHRFDLADFFGVHVHVHHVGALGKLLHFAGDPVVEAGWRMQRSGGKRNEAR